MAMLSSRPSIRTRAPQASLATVPVLALAACAIQIKEPSADVTPPSLTSWTKVVVTGNASYTGLKVTVDGTDFSNRMVSKANNRDEGDLGLLPGQHTLVASADV